MYAKKKMGIISTVTSYFSSNKSTTSNPTVSYSSSKLSQDVSRPKDASFTQGGSTFNPATNTLLPTSKQSSTTSTRINNGSGSNRLQEVITPTPNVLTPYIEVKGTTEPTTIRPRTTNPMLDKGVQGAGISSFNQPSAGNLPSYTLSTKDLGVKGMLSAVEEGSFAGSIPVSYKQAPFASAFTSDVPYTTYKENTKNIATGQIYYSEINKFQTNPLSFEGKTGFSAMTTQQGISYSLSPSYFESLDLSNVGKTSFFKSSKSAMAQDIYGNIGKGTDVIGRGLGTLPLTFLSGGQYTPKGKSLIQESGLMNESRLFKDVKVNPYIYYPTIAVPIALGGIGAIKNIKNLGVIEGAGESIGGFAPFQFRGGRFTPDVSKEFLNPKNTQLVEFTKGDTTLRTIKSNIRIGEGKSSSREFKSFIESDLNTLVNIKAVQTTKGQQGVSRVDKSFPVIEVKGGRFKIYQETESQASFFTFKERGQGSIADVKTFTRSAGGSSISEKQILGGSIYSDKIGSISKFQTISGTKASDFNLKVSGFNTPSELIKYPTTWKPTTRVYQEGLKPEVFGEGFSFDLGDLGTSKGFTNIKGSKGTTTNLLETTQIKAPTVLDLGSSKVSPVISTKFNFVPPSMGTNLISTQETSTATRSATIFSTSQAFDTSTKLETRQGLILDTSTIQATTPTSRLSLSSGLGQLSSSARPSPLKLVTSFDEPTRDIPTIFDYGLRFPRNNYGFSMPNIPSGGLAGGLGTRLFKGYQKKRYTPSYEAFVYQIKGKAPKGRETGLRLRPIPENFKLYDTAKYKNPLNYKTKKATTSSLFKLKRRKK